MSALQLFFQLAALGNLLAYFLPWKDKGMRPWLVGAAVVKIIIVLVIHQVSLP